MLNIFIYYGAFHAPDSDGAGQAFYTFPLGITFKKGVEGPNSMQKYV